MFPRSALICAKIIIKFNTIAVSPQFHLETTCLLSHGYMHVL